jgi:hypothetical protein
MFAAGIGLMALFAYWDFARATFPVVPRRFVHNRTVVIATLIGALDFVSMLTLINYELLGNCVLMMYQLCAYAE